MKKFAFYEFFKFHSIIISVLLLSIERIGGTYIMENSERNKLGLVASMSYIVGTIIGSGIFVSPTAILMHAGSIGLSLIIWIVGGLIATISSLVLHFRFIE